MKQFSDELVRLLPTRGGTYRENCAPLRLEKLAGRCDWQLSINYSINYSAFVPFLSVTLGRVFSGVMLMS